MFDWHRCSQDFPEVGLVGNRHSGVEKKNSAVVVVVVSCFKLASRVK